MKRTLIIVLALLSVLGAGAPAMAATPYPPNGPTVTTNKSVYGPGESATVRAGGFGTCAGGVVTFTINLSAAAGFRAATATASVTASGTTIVVTAPVQPDGTATTTVTLPTTLGKYTVVASCPGMASATTSFTISKIPVTGADSRSPLRIAAVLVLVGSGLLFVAIRRRRPASAV